MAGKASSSPAAVAAALAVGLVVGAGSLLVVLLLRERGNKAVADSRSRAEGGEVVPCPPAAAAVRSPSGMRVPVGSWHEADMTPPLPDDVVRLLQASRLCFLSTFSDDHPHLSLMNFTYYPADEVIILSTRRDTKKYKLVQTGRNVAILVHEFPDAGVGCSSGGGGGGGGGCSTKVTITLNGRATIQEGEQAERYRDLHARKNPDSKTFIVGPNIAIITVRVRSARICNVRDESLDHFRAVAVGQRLRFVDAIHHTMKHQETPQIRFLTSSREDTTMTRFFAITMGVVALGAVASASPEAAKNDNGLRGKSAVRKLYSHETKFCNSIGCPNGFQPIDKAWEVECYGGVCEVEQCCQAFCSSFPCPNGFQPISDASSTRCWGDDCSQEQCCQAFCSSFPCPNGFTPISYASTTRCDDDHCTQEQCCEAFCSYHPCPNGYVPIENAGNVLCDDDYCTTEQCCDLVDHGHHRERKLYSHETKFCNSIGCPNGFQPIDKAWEVECYGGVCEVEQCCQAFCSSFPCPNGFQPISDASSTRCWGDDCSQEQCCQAFCSSFPCPNGFTPISYASTTRCDDDHCTQEQCCEAFCSYHPCPNGYVPIESAGNVLCDDDYCTTEQCCDQIRH
eukprot:g17131.t1